MNVRDVLEMKGTYLRNSYVQSIKQFAKSRNANQEDRSIVTICEINFWVGEISERQNEWLIRYANRNQIKGDIAAANKAAASGVQEKFN